VTLALKPRDTSLTPQQRTYVIDAVRRALAESHPEIMHEGPGGANELAGHVDALVEIVRRTTADRVEPYTAQIMDDVCPHCAHQEKSGYCALRAPGPEQCALSRCTMTIVHAIADALRDMGDPVYVANRAAPEASTI
jgi:hypothetical protein